MRYGANEFRKKVEVSQQHLYSYSETLDKNDAENQELKDEFEVYLSSAANNKFKLNGATKFQQSKRKCRI